MNNQFDRIRQEIEQIENELKELRIGAGRNQVQGSLKELSRKNDRIKMPSGRSPQPFPPKRKKAN